MKKQKDFEKTIAIVATIVIAGIILFAVYLIFSSSMNITNNKNIQKETDKPKEQEQEQEQKPNTTEQITEVQLSTFSTNIYDKDEGRVYNIKLAIDKLNGTIITAGSTFSFNGTIGPMGESQGYKKATGFDSNGNKIEVFGGGMCQISSTIYNTALLANLEIVERHPHSRRVYYVPKDKDATIFYNSLDLKFKNTTGQDLKIVATCTKSNVTINLMKLEKKQVTI